MLCTLQNKLNSKDAEHSVKDLKRTGVQQALHLFTFRVQSIIKLIYIIVVKLFSLDFS